MVLVFTLLVFAAIYHYAGAGFFVLAIAVALSFFLLRTRPFNLCPHCRGQGSRTRLVGEPVYCRSCRGTGFSTPTEQRKAARRPPRRSIYRRW